MSVMKQPFSTLADFEKILVWLNFASCPKTMGTEEAMAWILFDGQTDRLSDALGEAFDRGFINHLSNETPKTDPQ